MELVEEAVEEPVEAAPSDDEVAAAMAPKTPKTCARYAAPPLAEQLPLTAALLGRNKRLRTATPDLKKRTHKDDEMTTRLLATDECIRTNNKVDTGDPDQAASMLHTLASHYDCHLQLMQLGGKGKYLTARDLMSYRFKLKLRMERLMPLVKGLAKDDMACKWDDFTAFYEGLPYEDPQMLKALCGVDLDGGAARMVAYDQVLVRLLESRVAHEHDMFNFGFLDADGKPYWLSSFGADKANANATTAIELGLARCHNFKRHLNAPWAAIVTYMGAHDEGLRELRTWLTEATKPMAKLCKDGLQFRCPGESVCNACEYPSKSPGRASIARPPAGRAGVKLVDGRHDVDHKMALVADQLWSRGAKGFKANDSFFAYYAEWEKDTGDVTFEKSRFYSAFQAEYPGRVGPDTFPFIPPLACVDDPVHLGLSLCAKGARDTVVAFAVRLESQDGTGVARRIEYALADFSDYHKRVRNAEAGAAAPMGELIENYVKPLKVARLKLEAEDLNIDSTGSKEELKHRVLGKLKERAASLDPAALVFGDRLTYAASVAEVTLGDAARHCAAYKVTGAQLTAIIGKRLKLIGREVRILFNTHNLLIRAMDPSSTLISENLDAAIKVKESEMDELTRQIKGMEEDRHGGAMDKDEAIEEATAKLDDMIDELDLMIVDQGTVNRGELPLDPLLARYGEYWRLLVAAIKPWVAPPATRPDEKFAALEGNEARVQEFFTLHRALGFKEKSSYLHGLEKHSTERIKFFEKHFPGHPPQECHCQVQEHANKLVKNEIAPFIGSLRKPCLKNSFFYVIREWSIRLLHFPETIHVRRLEKCGACGAFGHRRSSRICVKFMDYLKLCRERLIQKARDVVADLSAADE
ncbi:hypothetical protein JL720_4068 [Aureococcus anophagefferens]|nr:hypothetical protein JL720_4068 [Aureococcus anophagefferens]